ncbi:MAG: DNA polymerase I [Planctomycetes bacterium]|nr:DNA polymerase I [Planctomycetota bacterium]
MTGEEETSAQAATSATTTAKPAKKLRAATASITDTKPAALPPADASTSAEVPDLRGKSVWVVDANSLIFQVFHAIPEMTSPRGEPVNAVFGFTRDLLMMLDKQKPDYLFCAFDTAEPTFRHTLFEPYKGKRAEMPTDLAPQFEIIERMTAALGVPRLRLPGYEADDVLATVARIADEQGGECYLVTADKDCRQLITERVKIYNVRKDIVYNAAALKEDWGVRPDQVVDFQTLVGDSVDNIPGVPQIGPKTARELLEKFDTLDKLLERVDEVAGDKKRENLRNGREQAMLSRQLVRLDTHTPVPIDWAAGQAGRLNVPALIELCGEYGFHRFADQFRALQQAATPAVWEANYQLVDTPEAFAALVKKLAERKVLSFDTETTSVNPTQAEIVGYSFGWAPGEAAYVPVRGPAGAKLIAPEVALAALRPLLEDATIKKIGQNLKYDMLVLRTQGVELQGLAFDTMVASYLLEAGERNHNLDELSARYLNHKTITIDELIGSGRNQKRMDEVDTQLVSDYASEDADVPVRLLPILQQKLAEAQLEPLFQSLEMPLVEVLAELEFNGIRVDVPRLKALSDDYGGRLVALEKEIYELAGHSLNINSPKQLQQVLFTELNLPVQSRTKTGPSTDADVLEALAHLHALPRKILEYRQYAKLKGTYLDALPTLVNPRTGRVHASFHQAVAATGRLSSSDPNLQNIPIRTDAGREIRSAFLPGRDDWLLLAADYSQIELRVLAHYCRDATLIAAFERDEDIHTLVASQVYNVGLDAVTREMRRAAKAVNFGIIYGQSPFGLAKALDIDQTQAAQFIDAYFARYPGVESFLSGVLKDCRAQGFVSTLFGRRRAISGVRPDAGRQRNLAERTAINTVIQGSAADLIKQAMIAIHARLRRETWQAKMLLQIHDELIFEAPPEEIDRLAAMVREEMAGVRELAVPLKVDVKTGHNWADTESYA